jgi:hypothetical protein
MAGFVSDDYMTSGLPRMIRKWASSRRNAFLELRFEVQQELAAGDWVVDRQSSAFGGQSCRLTGRLPDSASDVASPPRLLHDLFPSLLRGCQVNSRSTSPGWEPSLRQREERSSCRRGATRR